MGKGFERWLGDAKSVWAVESGAMGGQKRGLREIQRICVQVE